MANAARSKMTLDLALAALRTGNAAEARSLLQQRLLEDPGNAALVAKLAEIAADDWRIDDATVLLRRACAADPGPQRAMALVRHLQARVGPNAALREIESLPPALASTFDMRCIEACELGKLGRHDREIAIYEQLTREAPDHAALWRSYGDSLKAVGRIDEAVAALRRSLRIRPGYGEAWWSLADLKTRQFSSQDVSAMRAALKKKPSARDALHLHFALGKALEDRALYDRSFRHYAEGNRLRAASARPEEMAVTGFVDLALRGYSKDVFRRRPNPATRDPQPIFIVGLPRSGSTLVEQILASHPAVEATTELPAMFQLWEQLLHEAARAAKSPFDYIAGLGSERLAALGAEYLERSGPYRATDKPYFVDKAPANWLHAGLIRLILPGARIIDARRHPMACGFSNFKQLYGNAVLFSYSLPTIGRFYADYLRMMDHYDQVLPEFIHHVLNEQLIADPEGEVRKMLGFLQLPFDPACLDFHKTKRAIRTPSAEQVRRGISREGVDQWRHYEPWLGPLKESLGEALETWDKPASAVHDAERRGK